MQSLKNQRGKHLKRFCRNTLQLKNMLLVNLFDSIDVYISSQQKAELPRGETTCFKYTKTGDEKSLLSLQQFAHFKQGFICKCCPKNLGKRTMKKIFMAYLWVHKKTLSVEAATTVAVALTKTAATADKNQQVEAKATNRAVKWANNQKWSEHEKWKEDNGGSTPQQDILLCAL